MSGPIIIFTRVLLVIQSRQFGGKFHFHLTIISIKQKTESKTKIIRLEGILYVFFHLFPVAVAATAMVMDIRTAKVDNGWILFSMFLGLSGCIWQKGIAGICSFALGSVIPLLLIILFLFGMMGAGDIKLFCALGGVMGPGVISRCIFVSFLAGASIAAVLLIINHNFCERILYFIKYVEHTVSTGKITSYRRKSISAPENFHFTIPVFISVLLYAGGIY